MRIKLTMATGSTMDASYTKENAEQRRPVHTL